MKEDIEKQEMDAVYVWPDGSWCYQEEYNEHEYSWRGDDFLVLWAERWLSEEDISDLVYLSLDNLSR